MPFLSNDPSLEILQKATSAPITAARRLPWTPIVLAPLSFTTGVGDEIGWEGVALLGEMVVELLVGVVKENELDPVDVMLAEDAVIVPVPVAPTIVKLGEKLYCDRSSS